MNIDLKALGLNDETIEEASQYNGYFLARVSAQYTDVFKIITEAGECRAKLKGRLVHAAQADVQYPAVGDWVLADRLDDTAGEAIICGVLKRRSCLFRKAAGVKTERQVIAANIDTVFICMSLNQNFNLRRIERYLAVVWESNAVPVILLTKSDLADDAGQKLTELESVAAGVDVITVSVLEEGGLDKVKAAIQPGKTYAFVGSSGVGKSTLINRLLGDDVLAVNEIREEDGRGRHTTTNRQLFLLPEGGVVIDTPGMRALELFEGDLAKTFADIEELSRQCRFGDCTHTQEPGCAVKRAVENGLLDAKRLESYHKLKQEMLFEERKQTMTAAQAEKQKFIGMMGSLGAYKRIINENPKYKK